MPRKSIWTTLILAMLLASFASLRVAPTASASPMHTVIQHVALQSSIDRSAAVHHALLADTCPQQNQHWRVILNDNIFAEWSANCVTGDACASSTTDSSAILICLYQDSNYGGDELEVEGTPKNNNDHSSGCMNLTDIYGPAPDGSWNDTVSSFRIQPGSATKGALWWDINDSNYYYLFGPPGSGRTSSTTYIGSTWNDKASSIQLDPPPSTINGLHC